MIEHWQWLTGESGRALCARAAACEVGDVAAIARLRAGQAPERVRLALLLAEARRRARGKWPDHAHAMLADPEAVEQATSQQVARYKARRIREVCGPCVVCDLCSGMGADSMALVEAGHRVLALDLSPARAWMTARNSGAAAAACDVTRQDFAGRVCHADPQRRHERGRSWRIEDYQPGLDFMRALTRSAQACAIKLGPGVDLAQVQSLTPDAEVEWISEAGRLTSAMLWTGPLATTARRATLLAADGHIHHLHRSQTVAPEVAAIAQTQRYLAVADAAVERAQLLGELAQSWTAQAMGELSPGLGVLAADAMVDSPWLTWFEVVDHMPWRVKKVKARLRELGAGIIEVKTRGKAVDTDVTQRALRGKGEAKLTVFVLRLGRQVEAWITKRCG